MSKRHTHTRVATNLKQVEIAAHLAKPQGVDVVRNANGTQPKNELRRETQARCRLRCPTSRCLLRARHRRPPSCATKHYLTKSGQGTGIDQHSKKKQSQQLQRTQRRKRAVASRFVDGRFDYVDDTSEHALR